MNGKCTKKSYRDKDQAMTAVHCIRNNNKDAVGKLPCRAYECPLCKKWHITGKEIDDDKHVSYTPVLDWSHLLAS